MAAILAQQSAARLAWRRAGPARTDAVRHFRAVSPSGMPPARRVAMFARKKKTAVVDDVEPKAAAQQSLAAAPSQPVAPPPESPPSLGIDVFSTKARANTVERRVLRRRGGGTYKTGDELFQTVQRLTVRTDEYGENYVQRGGLGEGKIHWYAVAVLDGKEAKYMSMLADAVKQLPPVEDDVGSSVTEAAAAAATAAASSGVSEAEAGGPGEAVVLANGRFLQTWCPTKPVKVYNARTEKMAVKVTPYKDGGWVFVRCVMDNAMYDAISKTLFFFQWRNAQPWSYAFEEEDKTQVMLPLPCSDDYMAQVRSWLAVNEDQTEEEAAREVFGDAGGTNKGISERKDESDEYTERDEFGRRVYKTGAWSGDYSNPSGWYDGTGAGGASSEVVRATAGGAGRATAPARRGGRQRGDWDTGRERSSTRPTNRDTRSQRDGSRSDAWSTGRSNTWQTDRNRRSGTRQTDDNRQPGNWQSDSNRRSWWAQPEADERSPPLQQNDMASQDAALNDGLLDDLWSNPKSTPQSGGSSSSRGYSDGTGSSTPRSGSRSARGAGASKGYGAAVEWADTPYAQADEDDSAGPGGWTDRNGRSNRRSRGSSNRSSGGSGGAAWLNDDDYSSPRGAAGYSSRRGGRGDGIRSSNADGYRKPQDDHDAGGSGEPWLVDDGAAVGGYADEDPAAYGSFMDLWDDSSDSSRATADRYDASSAGEPGGSGKAYVQARDAPQPRRGAAAAAGDGGSSWQDLDDGSGWQGFGDDAFGDEGGYMQQPAGGRRQQRRDRRAGPEVSSSSSSSNSKSADRGSNAGGAGYSPDEYSWGDSLASLAEDLDDFKPAVRRSQDSSPSPAPAKSGYVRKSKRVDESFDLDDIDFEK